jgi:hypothetical protein
MLPRGQEQGSRTERRGNDPGQQYCLKHEAFHRRAVCAVVSASPATRQKAGQS